ncbi:hypothetical protein B0T21DRAFT_132047 [Apiosordaria backusii]|uniref:Uncharacterized protein n=1 Tax=Apiosordaria backusii TaxID=314023 RepID=A0AA40END9_9PEZI|nr:hypothetical protein B0T21DRAFT_132047 [Apiosordaria backusii]
MATVTAWVQINTIACLGGLFAGWVSHSHKSRQCFLCSVSQCHQLLSHRRYHIKNSHTHHQHQKCIILANSPHLVIYRYPAFCS